MMGASVHENKDEKNKNKGYGISEQTRNNRAVLKDNFNRGLHNIAPTLPF